VLKQELLLLLTYAKLGVSYCQCAVRERNSESVTVSVRSARPSQQFRGLFFLPVVSRKTCSIKYSNMRKSLYLINDITTILKYCKLRKAAVFKFFWKRSTGIIVGLFVCYTFKTQ